MKEYKKPVNQTTKEKPICQYCLNDTKDKYQYYWVNTKSYYDIFYYELCCLDCIEKYNLRVNKPYFKSKNRVQNK